MNLEKMFKTPKEKFLPDDVKTAHSVGRFFMPL